MKVDPAGGDKARQHKTQPTNQPLGDPAGYSEMSTPKHPAPRKDTDVYFQAS